MNAPKKKTATSDYQGQYAELQKEFEQRTQAYNQMMKDQSVEMPPDANDAMAKARESFHKYRDSLLTQRANAFDLDMQKTQQMLSKGKITDALQMQLQMDAARQSIADRRKQLELDYGTDGILSGNTKQYQAEKAKLDELESKYLGGTEQYSNVLAMMSAFSEVDENGQTLMEKYLQLANGSEGIVDEKYSDQIDSLSAALTNLKNSFDNLIASITDTEALTGFLNVITELIDGITNFSEALGGAPALILALGAAMTALSENPVVFAIAGIAAAIGVIGTLFKLGNGTNAQSQYSATKTSTPQSITEQTKQVEKANSDRNRYLEQAQQAVDKAQAGTATTADVESYNNAVLNLREMGITCVKTVSSIEELSKGAQNVAGELNNAAADIKSKNADERKSIAIQAANNVSSEARRNRTNYLTDNPSIYNNSGLVAEEIFNNPDYEPLWAAIKTNIIAKGDPDFANAYSEYLSKGGKPLSLPDGVSYDTARFGKTQSDSAFTGFLFQLIRNGGMNGLMLSDNHSSIGVKKGNLIDPNKIKDNEYVKEIMKDSAVLGNVLIDYYLGFEKGQFVTTKNPDLSRMDSDNVLLGDVLKESISAFYTSYIEDAALAELLTDRAVAELNNYNAKKGTADERSQIVSNAVINPFMENGTLMSASDAYNKGVELTGDRSEASAADSAAENTWNLPEEIAAASALSTANGQYGTIPVQMYEMWRKAKGATVAERFQNLMDSIQADETMRDVLPSMFADNQTLADAFYAGLEEEKDENGNVVGHKLKSDMSGLDYDMLGVQIAALNSNQLGALAYRGKRDIANSALDAFQLLDVSNDRQNAWTYLGDSGTIAQNQQRNDLQTILGEEVLNKYLTGGYSDLGGQYLGRTIRAYGTDKDAYTDYEYGDLAKNVLNLLDNATTPVQKQAVLDALPSNMLDELDSKIPGFSDYRGYVTMNEEARANSGVNDKTIADAREALDIGIEDTQVRQIEKYNENLDELATMLTQISKGGKNAAMAMQTINSKLTQNAYNRWALEKYKSGDRSDEVTKQLASGFGIDQAELKEASEEDAAFFISSIAKVLEGQTTALNRDLSAAMNALWQQTLETLPSDFDFTPYISADGTFDASGFIAACQAMGIPIDQAWADLVVNASNKQVTFSLTADGQTLSLNASGASAKPKSSGGGGGGKSDADKLVDKIKKGQALYEHRIKMIQYKQTEYTNADELTNYGRMIEKEMEIEQSYLPIVEENIQKLKDQMAKTKVGSDDWYTLRDAILSAEETYAEINKTLDENKKKLEENRQAILKLHTDLEDSVTEEIKNRIQKKRDMTDGAVSMQQTILDAIKQRYQDEWELQKKDVEKKKEALEEEKRRA